MSSSTGTQKETNYLQSGTSTYVCIHTHPHIHLAVSKLNLHLPCKAELVERPSSCLSLCVYVSKRGQQRIKATLIASFLCCCCPCFSNCNTLLVYLTLLTYTFLTVYPSTVTACPQRSPLHLLVCPGCALVELFAWMLASLSVYWH